MDAMKLQKLKHMMGSQFPYNHILVHSVIALICSTSFLYMFPSPSGFIMHLLFNALPSFWCSFVNPKCLFIVVNVIVGFLIFGESKSSSSSSGDQIYEEYVKRKTELNLKERSIVVVNKAQQLEERNLVKAEVAEAEEIFEDATEKEEEEEHEEEEHEEEHEEEEEGVVVVVDDDKEKERGRDDDSEEQGLPTEELNRRVEAFIARVNKQRWLEVK